MSFVQSGENIVRVAKQGLLMLGLLCLVGCGSSNTDTPAAGPQDDRALIQESLTETITRWHNRDKAGLYDNEFQYLRERMTFDDYLKTKEMKLDADTVTGILVTDVQLFNRDSALVTVEVQFEGPKKMKSVQHDVYPMYFFQGRWIKPTLSNLDAQLEYDKIKKAYEEAAEEEEKDTSGN